MAIERTLSIIKPDATRRNLTGRINARFEDHGLRIIAQRRLQLSRQQAEQFYAVHKARPFFKDLVAFMISGPVVVQVLEGENAVVLNREIMGATDPKKAASGTIRKDFAESIEANSVHGSDAPENAQTEIAFFFAGVDICPSGTGAGSLLKRQQPQRHQSHNNSGDGPLHQPGEADPHLAVALEFLVDGHRLSSPRSSNSISAPIPQHESFARPQSQPVGLMSAGDAGPAAPAICTRSPVTLTRPSAISRSASG